MIYVYILESKINNELYVGSTVDLRRRFREHNEGKEISTKRYRPWKLIYYEAYCLEKLARMREKRLKYHGNAIRELKKRLGIHPAPLLGKSGAGFTLIEIMLVITLIGILIAAGLGSFTSSQMKGRDSKRKGDLKHIAEALELYYNDKGKYPPASGGLLSGCGTGDTQLCNWGATFSDNKGTIYMVTLPNDPAGGRNYYYAASGTSPTSYQLYARLENVQDLSVPKNATTGKAQNYGISCGSANCNYGVASTNTLPETGMTLTDDP